MTSYKSSQRQIRTMDSVQIVELLQTLEVPLQDVCSCPIHSSFVQLLSPYESVPPFNVEVSTSIESLSVVGVLFLQPFS
jgi:hypothetical protein